MRLHNDRGKYKTVWGYTTPDGLIISNVKKQIVCSNFCYVDDEYHGFIIEVLEDYPNFLLCEIKEIL